MRKLLTLLTALLAALALGSPAAHAHYLWATIDDHQARFALLEDVNTAPSAAFEKYVTGLAPVSGKKKLTVGAPQNGATYAFLLTDQKVVTVNSTVGAKERDGSAPYLLVYHAKGTASLADAATVIHAPAEILARRDGQSLVIQVLRNGKPVLAPTAVWVHVPGATEPKSVQTNDKGEARIELPTATQKGFIGLRAMVTESTSGENQGKKYETIHHWATLTFPSLPGESAQTTRTTTAL